MCGYPGPSSKVRATLKPQEGEHSSLPIRTFDVSDDRAAGVIHKFHVYLHALSLQTGPAQHLVTLVSLMDRMRLMSIMAVIWRRVPSVFPRSRSLTPLCHRPVGL